MSEKEFQSQVLQLAGMLGYWVYHTHDSRRSQPGMPDLLLAKAGRPVIFAELKSQTGKPTAEQQKCMDLLRATGARVFLWKPDDFPEILRILSE